MSKLAVFAAPKPFRDAHIATIQRNAIRSWKALGPEVDVLLLGEEPGLAEAARDLGVRQLPAVNRSPQGTPQIDSMVALAREASSAPILLLTNADILLLPETLQVIDAVSAQLGEFLLAGRRQDLDVDAELDFSPGWEQELRARVAAHGRLGSWNACDYFIFPRQLYRDMPAFSIGRAGWDNWMLYHAISAPWPAIDLTKTLLVVHQNHDYAHLPGGQPHHRHPESDTNVRLAGGMRQLRTLMDVPYEWVDGRLRKKPFSLLRALRGLENALQPEERVGRGLRWRALLALRRLQKALLAGERR